LRPTQATPGTLAFRVSQDLLKRDASFCQRRLILTGKKVEICILFAFALAREVTVLS